MSDPICMYLLFPEEPGKQLLSSWRLLGLPQLKDEAGVTIGLGFCIRTPRALKAKQIEGKSTEGVAVQREIIYIDTGMWKSRVFLSFCWSTVLTFRKEQVRWRDSPLTPASLTGPKGSVKML